jgi:hypothetical protein
MRFERDMHMKNCRITVLILTLVLATLISPGTARADKYIQVPGLIDLRTDFSDGSHTIEFIIQLARKRGSMCYLSLTMTVKSWSTAYARFSTSLKKESRCPQSMKQVLEITWT